MRGKAVFCHSRKIKNGKKLLLDLQLQLTRKQIGTKIGNMAFINSEIISGLLLFFFCMFDVHTYFCKYVTFLSIILLLGSLVNLIVLVNCLLKR